MQGPLPRRRECSPDPRPERWSRLQSILQRRGLRYFRRPDLLDAHVTHHMATWQASGGFCGGEMRIIAFVWASPVSVDR